MLRIRFFRFVTLAAALVPATAFGEEYRVEQASLPIPFLAPATAAGERPKVDTVIEASAIEPIGDGKLLLVAHDKTTELFVVETATGQVVGKPVTCSRFPNGAKIPPKWEGLARDDQGFYYAIGTHSGKADDDRAARSFLFRFRLVGGTEGSPIAIDESSVRRWQLGAALKSALAREVADAAEVDKRKIEGLTVRSVPATPASPARVELIVGLREPFDQVRAFAADISNNPADGAELSLKTLFTFNPGTREGNQSQLTSLHYLSEWNGFLVVTATEDEQNAFHGNTLWFVPGEQIKSGANVKPVAIYVFEPAMKAEGLCTLPDPSGPNPRAVRLAISFDNDPHTTHIPSRLQTLTVSRRESGSSSGLPGR